MNDQADALRRKMTRVKTLSQPPEKKHTKVIAVVSGKGGVGKSNFVVNFSLALQKAEKKVLIIDLDIGMANIDILLGQTSRYSFVDMIERDMSIWSVIETAEEGLSYIAGGSALNDVFQMDKERADFFYRQLQSLESEFDYIFLDMGAGISTNSSHFLLSCHDIFLVTTPEPTSITDAYGMIKYITLQDPTLPVTMIVNRAHSTKEGHHTSSNMLTVTKRFLNKDINYLASIPDDDVVRKAVRAQKPFVLYSPRSKPATAMIAAVHKYLKAGGHDLKNEGSISSFISKLKGFMKN